MLFYGCGGAGGGGRGVGDRIGAHPISPLVRCLDGSGRRDALCIARVARTGGERCRDIA
jgi:hypothetical protein